MKLTYATLKDTFAKLNYKWYDDRPNLIGIRTSIDVPNIFNDLFVVAYTVPKMPANFESDSKVVQRFLNTFGFTDEFGEALKEDGIIGRNTLFALADYKKKIGEARIATFTITTDPGTYWLNHPMNVSGTAILKEGQYIDVYAIGYHKQKKDHEALIQQYGKVTVYRDADKDTAADERSKTETGFFGINIHRANLVGETANINKWSAGCQVFQKASHLNKVLDICKYYKDTVNNRFTYTLLTESQLGGAV